MEPAGPLLSSNVDETRTPTALPKALTSRIPGELHDYIIDHLYDNKHALAACTLVCSSWLPRARLHLRTSAKIKRRASAMSFLDIITVPRSLNTLGPVIRSLSVYTSKCVDPVKFTAHLPALTQLYVSACARYFRPGEWLQTSEWSSWFRPHAHQLTDLAIGHALCESLFEFATMLPEFGSLRHLALINVHWHDPSLPAPAESFDTQPGAHSRLPNLQSLILTGQNVHIVPYLLASGVTEITRLDLRPGKHIADHTMQQQIRDIAHYMRLLGPSIQELDLYDEFFITPGVPSIDISHHPNLRNIWFHGVDLLCEGPWVVDALTQITSPHVRVISFDAYLEDLLPFSETGEPPGWAVLQRAATENTNISRLCMVQLRWLSTNYDEGLDTTVMAEEILRCWRWTMRPCVALEVTPGLSQVSILEPLQAFERWFDRQPVSC
ncbi:hypothetical protein FPV67DRAFT_291713 [Lyophyllum atratum]|nr:hypothetical protein FPV67DRAFT_291713 [Lyophyllum atratum]